MSTNIKNLSIIVEYFLVPLHQKNSDLISINGRLDGKEFACDVREPGSSVHGTLQERILEWVAIPFSREIPDSGIEPECLASQT